MFSTIKRVLATAFLPLVFGVTTASACEICTIPRLGRQQTLVSESDTDRKWFFEFLFEEQNWDEQDPAFVHSLHHAGHHVHDKTAEYFYHFVVGREVGDKSSITFDLPYVVRKSFGVEHANLGVKESSEGLGDLTVLASTRVYDDEGLAFNVVAGLKVPTGETDKEDSTGTLFEPELQPGTGSLDIVIGGVFEKRLERSVVKGNLTYTFKTEGEQDYTFGDLLSIALFYDYVLNPAEKNFQVKVGVDLNYQYAQENENNGVPESSSGGHLVFLGPTLTVEMPKGVALFVNVLFPVYQDFGGVHQEMDYVWTAGGKISF